ncbi:satellite-binding protein 1 Dp1 [Lycorma delicatula]|uniref:satellite-binding protein 1 Dp1 n=1 Tax=Lycorma delicatula TaxID=130591 RepID=UPI003F515924
MQVEESVVNVTGPTSVVGVTSSVSSIPVGVSAPMSGQSFDNMTAAAHHLDNNNSSDSSCKALNSFSYDEVFPALPDSATHHQQINNTSNTSMGQWNDKMRIGSSDITQIVKVKAEERKYDENNSFGERESVRTCVNITKDTKAIIEMSILKDQSLTFLVTGRPENVSEARRKILTHFQTQANKSIVIPKDHHKWVLGKMGQRLKDLERDTETKITVPAMNDPSETVTVTGTKEGIERAIHEIKMISEEQSKKAFERITVPKIYLPFVCGPHNAQLNAMMAETGTKITILPPTVAKDEVTISGDKDGVAAAKEKILSIVKDVEERCATVSVEVLKSQHKYVIGPKGSAITEILDRTGVSVEMPNSDATNTIILRGPQDRLGHALSLVYEKANSVTTQTVDVPNWIHRYIIGKKGDDIRKLKEDFPKVHVEFMDKEDKIKIEGPPEEVKIAREKLMTKANELISQLTYTTLTVDPKHYKHIIGKNGANVNRLKVLTDAIITISANDVSVIRIEGSKQGVEEATRELEGMIYKLENETEEEIIIEHKYHSSIIGQKGEKIKEINSMFNQEVQITFPNANEKKDVVKIRGPKEDVDKCCKYLKNFVKQLAENRYVLEVPIYKQYHKLVIGKGGVNIRKIKEETHTKIDLPAEGEKSDVITITGKKENVEEARDRILKIQNEQANIVSEEISLPMTSSISSRGKLMRSITEECSGVSIRFPAANSHSDKVSLRGPKEDVEKVRQQLQELATELHQNSFTAEVKAKPQHHRFLIGKNGANIRKIRESTGCRIIFPSEQDEDQELITIIGKKESVKQAKEELEAAIKEIDNIVEEEMSVDPKHHKQFMVRRSGQSLLQKISDDCGVISISFPRQGVPSDKVTLRGSHECIQLAKQKILEVVDDLENQVTIECIIPNQHHRSLTGHKHIKVQELCATYNVQIKFPERINQDDFSHQNSDYDGHQLDGIDNDGSEQLMNGDTQRPLPSDIILITGKPEKCEAAKQALLDSVPVTETIDVPYDYHRAIIGTKGQTIRDLSNRYDVHINVPQSTEHLDTITINGSRANIKLAKEAIQDKMIEIDAENEDRRRKSFEVKLNVPAEYFPKIIGKKGSVINKIRDDHGVQINLPPRGSEEENTITIVGYQEKAEAACNVIMKIVNELKSMVKDEVLLDARIHSRLIGTRGRSIRKVMDQYKVEIKFARPSDPNPDVVIITGMENDVAEAKEHLLELQEEYLMDMDYEREYRPNHREESNESNPFSGSTRGVNTQNNSSTASGFFVKGAPWEQKAPDTASTEEFPTFGSNSMQTPTHSVSWGPRR